MRKTPKASRKTRPEAQQEQTEIIRLSIEDQRQIAEAIINPPEPGPALLRAVRHYRELFGVE